jgi:RNA 3'-terminal phosphate cyclase
MNELSNAIINDFIKMTERIANGKTNVLDFGSTELTFYQGEIHIIKMVISPARLVGRELRSIQTSNEPWTSVLTGRTDLSRSSHPSSSSASSL